MFPLSIHVNLYPFFENSCDKSFRVPAGPAAPGRVSVAVVSVTSCATRAAVVGLQAYWSREFAEFVPTWRKAPPRSAPGRSWGSLLPKSAFDPSKAFLLLSRR